MTPQEIQAIAEKYGWWMLLATPDQPTREQVQQAYDHQLPTDLEDEWEECDNCDGKCIADYGEGDETCRTCEGEGRINVSARKRETREAAEEDRADAGRDNHE